MTRKTPSHKLQTHQSLWQKYFLQHNFLFLIATLTVLAFLVRFIGQPKIPYGFHRDEAVYGYDAYSILKTGRDQYGQWFPLQFRALGDYPPGIYIYLTSIIMFFLGPTELAERLPAILFGAALVPLITIFVDHFFKNKNLAIITALLVAISPWDVVQSRASSEAITGLFFAILGWLFFSLWVSKKSWRWLLATGLMYFLAIYSYNAIKVELPLIHLILLWFFWSKMPHKKIAVATTILFFGYALWSVFGSTATAISFHSTSIFNTLSKINYEAYFNREALFHIPSFVSRGLHNKISALFFQAAANYGGYFSPEFLFLKGGFPERYSVPNVGLLYVVTAPFLIWGLVEQNVLSKRQKIFIFLLLVLAPLAGVITSTDVPNVKRSLFLFLPLHFFTAVGFYSLIQSLRHRLLQLAAGAIVMIALAWNALFFANQYIVHTAYETIFQRSYGYKQVIDYVEANKSHYKKVVFFENNDAPYIFYLFYSKYPPAEYQKIAKQNPNNIFATGQRKIWSIGQYTFDPGSCPQTTEPDVLYISPANRCIDLPQEDYPTVFVASAIDRSPVFVVYTQGPSLKGNRKTKNSDTSIQP